MSNRIIFPVKNFAAFVESANVWFNKTSSVYKQGLEICLQQVGSKDLSCSVYGDLNFIEAILECPEPFSLPHPIYLELGQLAKYSFKTDYLHLVVPDTERLLEFAAGTEKKTNMEARAQFKAKDTSFKIPFRPDTAWKKNRLNLPTDFSEFQRIKFSNKFITENMNRLILPDSFKQPKNDIRYQLFQKFDGKDFIYAHDFDGMGAYCHEFKITNFPEAELHRIRYQNDFMTPLKKGPAFEHFTLANSKNGSMCYGSLDCAQESGVKKFVWAQPTHEAAFDQVPTELEKRRSRCQWSLSLWAGELADKIEQATQFFADKEMYEVFVEISAVGSRFSISGSLIESEIVVEGALLEPAQEPVKIRIQPRCLVDYLKLMDAKLSLNIEVYSDSTIIYQVAPDKTLIYWAPIQDR
jgi:hypothetical protein